MSCWWCSVPHQIKFLFWSIARIFFFCCQENLRVNKYGTSMVPYLKNIVTKSPAFSNYHLNLTRVCGPVISDIFEIRPKRAKNFSKWPEIEWNASLREKLSNAIILKSSKMGRNSGFLNFMVIIFSEMKHQIFQWQSLIHIVNVKHGW